ncbi:hypothetical protein OEG79_20465 [Pseudomonas sp. Z8(2022)]|jgi:hypothetical protein|uniref:hypothetical protein n=1 Tax=Pseudomonas sp. Z8(2022) TaxID=2962597 RepID=UPI0021F4BD74|nr:hypothetical protein [Pseudomonas sp. Z8(2022)]UYP30395.1 hypothetical protein OEG79_20465 [Pseudomonas sp. Z8(2022)]
MNPAIAMPEAPRKGRGRLQLLLILAIVVGPMFLASAMYQWRFWVPETRSYHGVLIGDGRTLADLGVQAAVEPRWQILVTAPGACEADCQQLVYLARQIQIGLNRETSRASHGLALAEPLPADYDATLKREYPQLGRYQLDLQAYEKAAEAVPGAQLWLVDPHGNLVLRYPAGSNGKAILDDLRYLLKISLIG